MRKNRIGMGMVFAVLFAWGATCQARETRQPRIIQVTGEAEIRVVPDEAVLALGVQTLGKTLATAKADHDARVRKALAVIRGAGIEEKDVQTSRLTMGPKYDRVNDRETLVGYEVSQSLAITIRNLGNYEDLLGSLLEAGINRVDNIEFRAREEKKYREEARKMALRAAREKATVMANELNQRLGRPYRIVEGDYGFLAGFSNVSVNMSAAQMALPPTISPGELLVRALVSVEFELTD